MNDVRIVSLDAEGTLVTHNFSKAIWREAIPALYARKREIELAEAKELVYAEYDEIGEGRLEWYDIEFWFRRLALGSPEPVIESCLSKAECYPEVAEVLCSLSTEYTLIVASNTPREMLRFLLRDIEPYFARVFSSISHYRQLKSPEFYLGICREMGVTPDEVVHVGDSWRFDVLNARQAGIRSIYLDRSGDHHHESLTDLTQLAPFLRSPQ